MGPHLRRNTPKAGEEATNDSMPQEEARDNSGDTGELTGERRSLKGVTDESVSLFAVQNGRGC